jgi:[phosphatase 2A protein]-leucine-carboxy methyltransferase
MAAPNIPNLNTLRENKTPGRGRARGGLRGGGLGATGFPEDDASARDRVIQNTDQDAVGSRLSAANAGYVMDCFAVDFYKGDSPPKRFPIINRGES